MTNRFRVVGYLVPSHTGKTFKVVVENQFIGIVSKEALLNSLRARPMLPVEISRFIVHPKPSEQQTLKGIRMADPEKLALLELKE
jgi:hypothetical protein